jgi:hypothetical protein
MVMVIDGTAGITFPDTSKQYNSYYNFKNRIINGAMMIDQRNAGASVTLTSSNVYNLDRWFARAATGSGTTAIQSTTVPANFKNSLLITVGTGASPGASDNNYVAQRIEGLNMADFGWGTANATTVTLSFWVRSSVTGTFGGAIQNNALDRSYPFTYTINAANTWEFETITIPGDTTGTWLTTNGVGLVLTIDLGTGSTFQGTAGAWAASDFRAASGTSKIISTSGATFAITGVQLEKGTQATSFDYRPYGTELALCQRYFESSFPIGTAPAQNIGKFNHAIFAGNSDGGSLEGVINFSVIKRAAPSTVIYYNPSAANANFSNGGTVGQISADVWGIDVFTTTVTGARSFVNWSATSEL